MTALKTDRLTLRPFDARDLPDFIALHADPQSMVDYGRPDSAAQARSKLERYLQAEAQFGLGRLYASDVAGFIGYVGVYYHADHSPLGPHAEIGWRLLPRAWGHGYATEAARAALSYAFQTSDIPEVMAYTAPDNLRSQAVMERLGLTREPTRDFTEIDSDIGLWHGLVWIANRADWI
jgi:RimJ/RimL family protein N-acetyltransferase